VLKREREIPVILADTERQLARLKEQCSAGDDTRTLQSIEIRDFLARDIPRRGYLLAPIIPEQGLVMAYGPRGLGKTHLSVGTAVAVTAGGKFLRWTAPKPASVLLIDGEMPAGAIQARFADAIKASELEPQAPLNLVTPDFNWACGMPDLSTTEGQKAVDALVTEDTRLIIVDNLSSLMRSGVENDAESWLPLQTWALRHRAAGRSVLFIHHAGKGGSQRGTSRREDVLDVVIAIRRPSDYRHDEGARFELHIEKGRSLFGKDAAPFEAQLTADARGNPVWTVRDVEVHQMKQILELHDLGMKPTDIAAELGISRANVYRKLKTNGSADREATGHA
jgi:putative DNA primase/helicase